MEAAVAWETSPEWAPSDSALAHAAMLTIYRIAVADFAEREAALLGLLTLDEQTRAARYLRPADRARFLVGRGCLRVLLGQHLGCPPEAVILVTNAFGKPQLALPAAVQFNVAHSGNWVLVAVGPQAVGVDVEKVEVQFDHAAVAAHSFSPAERHALANHAAPQEAFYALWTRQEARAKAAGHGLSDGVAEATAEAWTVRSFEVAPGYPGAVAHAAAWQPVIQFRTVDAAAVG